MLTYAKLQRNRREFLALTGLTPKEFKMLLPAFGRVYQRRYSSNKTLRGTRRRRKAGGGRKSSLDTDEQKLLFVLVYLKTYPLQVLLGKVFDLSQSCANRWVHRLLPVLRQALKDLGVRPERNPRRFARHERQLSEPLDLVIDGTERRRQRPKSPEKQAVLAVCLVCPHVYCQNLSTVLTISFACAEYQLASEF